MKRKLPDQTERAEMCDLYENGMPGTAIGERLGWSSATVFRALHAAGVKTRRSSWLADGPVICVDPESQCWLWVRHRDKDGYGKRKANGKSVLAHRFYYEQENGPLPDWADDLDHLCRRRACVNPDHLEPVIHAENCHRGEQAKLDPVRVREIRSLCAEGWLQGDIAAAYGVTQPLVSAIKRRAIWTAA